MSKGNEWVQKDENYRLQGAKPKATRQQGLPAIAPNSTGQKRRKFTPSKDRHLQENESRSKFKSPRKRPQELISVGNASLDTAQQGDKIPYCRTSSAPLPRLSRSRISPRRLSSSPRMPLSAPAQMTSAFQWPPIQEHKEQPKSKNNYNELEAGEPESGTSTKMAKASVHLPYIQPQHHLPGESVKSQCNPTYKELGARHAGEVKRSQAVSSLPQKGMSVDKAGVAADREKNHNEDMIGLCETARKQNMLKGIGPRSSSPDPFVALLIANTEKLILNDSIESPTLQERKKLARKRVF